MLNFFIWLQTTSEQEVADEGLLSEAAQGIANNVVTGVFENIIYGFLSSLVITFVALVISNTRNVSGNIFKAFQETVSSVLRRDVQSSFKDANLFSRIVQFLVYMIAVSPLLLVLYALTVGLFSALTLGYAEDPTVGTDILTSSPGVLKESVVIALLIISAIPAFIVTRLLEYNFTWVGRLISLLLFIQVSAAVIFGLGNAMLPMLITPGWVIPTSAVAIITVSAFLALYFVYSVTPQRWRTDEFGYEVSVGKTIIRIGGFLIFWTIVIIGVLALAGGGDF